MRNLSVIALLVSGNEAMQLTQKSRVTTKTSGTQVNEMTNPEWVPGMTMNHWRLYGAKESMDMYRREDYMVNKNLAEIDTNKVELESAKDNLVQAKE
jgi:hypothetical protein